MTVLAGIAAWSVLAFSVLLFVVQVAAHEFGYWVGRRRAARQEVQSEGVGTVVGGMLAPCKVVAIDEGFTACDDAHLAKVPDFLEWLVQNGHARTVVLVSHLTEIRSRISRVVEIQRPFVG